MEIKLLDVTEKIPHNDRALRVGKIISSDKDINDLFGDRWDRMYSGVFTYLITCDNKDVGFINVLFERDDNEFLAKKLTPQMANNTIAPIIVNFL